MTTHDTDTRLRRRGRPAGTSWHNKEDAPALAKVASIVLAEGVTPSTAMHRLGYLTGEAGLRRMQRKWKIQGRSLMAEAKSRKARTDADASALAQQRARGELHMHQVATGGATLPPHLAYLADLLDGPVSRAMRQATFPTPSATQCIMEMEKTVWMTDFRLKHGGPMNVPPSSYEVAMAEIAERMKGPPGMTEYLAKMSSWSDALDRAGALAMPQWMRGMHGLPKPW